jgi:hypothetical protein
MQPDIAAFRAFVDRIRRRLTWLSAAEGAAAGLLVALIVAVVRGSSASGARQSVVVGAVLAIVGVVVRVIAARDRRTRVVALVEARAPQCRNLLVTASEMQSSHSIKESVASTIYARAAAMTRSLDPASLFPARNALAALAASVALWTFGVTRVAAGKTVLPARGEAASVATIDGVDVVVVPPAYVGRQAKAAHDPARVDALAGSRLRLTIRARASRIVVETLHSRDTLTPSSNAFTTELVADADGYVALEPSTASGQAGTRRLIGLSVSPDEPPKVRITAPGKDVVFADGHHTIDLAIDASDDIGLASLKVRYTKVSGSGERFTFSEGDVPVQITRTSDRAWTARAHWPLDALALDAGDMVVYRAIATDHRPGATPSESDSYIAEILAPGGNAAPGFSLDPEQERYAVSQQMVILKTERLAAKKASMTAEAYSAEAQDIGGEQRKVRAEFVFMMGGELADAPDPNGDINNLNEEKEAEGEDDLLAGRSANQGRVALLRAIRAMSRASTALTNVDLETALTHERAALKQLESAFSRSRILLRALTERERLDLSRRMSGALTDAARATRPTPGPELDSRVLALRRTLASIAELAGEQKFDATASGRASTLAEAVLRIDASSKPLQEVASTLNGAASAIARSRTDEAHAKLDQAATEIAAVLKGDVLAAPATAGALDPRRMNGALTDALRNQSGGGSR